MDGDTFIYAVDYIKNNHNISNIYNYSIDNANDIIYFTIPQNKQYKEVVNLTRGGNIWNIYNNNTPWVGEGVGTPSTVRIYFPDFSPEVYKSNVKYALDISVFIQQKQVVLGSFLIDRSNTYAAPKIVKFHGENYYEYIDVEIVDPYDLLYSEEFETTRKNIKSLGKDDIEYNNDSSSLYITLNPIIEDVDFNGNTIYLIDDSIDGGQQTIDIASGLSDFLNYKIKYVESGDSNIGVSATMEFNNVYNQDLSEYMKETYGLESNVTVTAKMLLAIDKMSYSILIHKIPDGNPGSTEHIFKFKDENPNNSIYDGFEYVIEHEDGGIETKKLFSNWDYWVAGMKFKSVLVLYKQYKDDAGEVISTEEYMKIHSNELPITQDMFSKLIVNNAKSDSSEPVIVGNYINLDEVNMKIQNLNIINDIQLSTTTYTAPEVNKNSIIMPVFYRARDLGNIVLHPEVDENICINLDAYKSKVDTFVLQIEGVKFVEIGTTSAGTIFKVIGSMLPKRNVSGTYYILSQDYELVTSGKYIYEY
jgi:hypothetical protein